MFVLLTRYSTRYSFNESGVQYKLKPFSDYLTYMFEEKTSWLVGSRAKDDKVMPWDMCRAAIFYPTRKDIVEAEDVSVSMSVQVAITMMRECRDETKATADYLSAINGKRSMIKVTEEEKLAGRGKDASNSVSESLHSSSTIGFKYTTRPDHACAEGQTRSNNDFGRQHNSLVTGRMSKYGVKEEELGAYHCLVPELQHTFILTSMEKAKVGRAVFDNNLLGQFRKRRNKEEERLEVLYDSAMEMCIVAMYFFDQYHSQRCWMTPETAQYFYDKLGSESKRLDAVKEQILIRYLGLGWAEAHHAWSENERGFTSAELFKHFLEVVLPLADELIIPERAPLSLPELPAMPTVGTTSELAKDLEKAAQDKIDEIRAKAQDTKASREADGKGDRHYEEQMSTPPEFETTENQNLPIKKMRTGFKIEVLFEYTGADGSKCLGWYNGKVHVIVNKEKTSVKIKWNENCVGDSDKRLSTIKLAPRNWNPKVVRKNGWREYFS